MAVMRHSIIFGGVDSADYGIYIGGEGVFNAPKREVEMIEIPGRNGAFALDKGRFENITVEYTAINHEADLATFSANLDAFRNALSAQKGYQRLGDTFHPDEYRMAVFREGLEIEPIEYNTASEFKIKFDCKPQRFLTSGETAVTVSSGDTLTNPTLFEASPLLAVKGYGTIYMNSQEIVLDPKFVGHVQLAGSGKPQINYSSVLLMDGDTITVSGYRLTLDCVFSEGGGGVSNFAYTIDSQQTTGTPTITFAYPAGNGGEITLAWPPQTFTQGADTTLTDRITFTATCLDYLDQPFTASLTVDFKLRNNAVTPATSYFRATNDTISDTGFDYQAQLNEKISSITGFSTQTALGNPTYIDCDLGEAYKYVDGVPASLNSYIDLGSNLPVLQTGSNTITYDNTITEVVLTPHWWKV